MESWTYASEEKGYMLSDEMDYSLEAFMRSRRALVEWDSKASCTFERDGFISDKEAIKSMEFVDLGFPDLFRRPVHGSQTLEASSCEQDSNCSKKVNSSSHAIALDSTLGEEESDLKHSCEKMNSSTHAIALNSTLGEEESNLKHSGSLVESKCHDSSLIDLKLGRLSDCKDASTDKNDKEGFTFSSIYPSTLAKRARTSSSPTQTPVCQVYGCNMDLSLSKEYHKRHKVCDVHSKTAKVIVNGIEQRFCQQCSRFHLLAEFDDGKRSCRRRLAGHNERRRKPQFDYISGKTQKMLQSCQGTKCLGASLQKRPQFAFQDMYRSSIFYSGKYEQTNQSGNIKFEDESIYSPQLAVPITLGQELSRASNSSSCALSLLSAQSQDLPRYSAGSLISQGICTQQRSDGQVSETIFGVSSADKYVPNESFSCGINSMEVTKNRSIMLSDAGHALQLKVQGDDICQPSDALQLKVQEDDICQPSDLLNAKYRLPPEHGATVDLFQLSSHLQRVEQQRNSLPVKQENEDGCFFPAV